MLFPSLHRTHERVHPDDRKSEDGQKEDGRNDPECNYPIVGTARTSMSNRLAIPAIFSVQRFILV
jgi:hypothetical protein